jgi:hypothetical protein
MNQYVFDKSLELASSMSTTGTTSSVQTGKKRAASIVFNNITTGDATFSAAVQESADNSSFTNIMTLTLTGLANTTFARCMDINQEYVNLVISSVTGSSSFACSSIYISVQR